MVHNEGKKSLKESLEKAHGKIIAIHKYAGVFNIIHEDLTAHVYDPEAKFLISKSKSWTNRELAINTWLDCQVKLAKTKTISDEYLERFFFFDRHENGLDVYRAVEMGCHRNFELYFWSTVEMEMEIEIETF
ncbi:MAG: hypothetical protein ACFFG0_15530 [Candidatus Thorarchaeota archaeon]